MVEFPAPFEDRTALCSYPLAFTQNTGLKWLRAVQTQLVQNAGQKPQLLVICPLSEIRNEWPRIPSDEPLTRAGLAQDSRLPQLPPPLLSRGLLLPLLGQRRKAICLSSTCLIKENIIIVWHITFGECTERISYIRERGRGGGGGGKRKTNWLPAEVQCQTSEESCSFWHCGKDHGNEGPREWERQMGRFAAPPSDWKTEQIGEAIHFPEPGGNFRVL